jgi:hypothetical protein
VAEKKAEGQRLSRLSLSVHFAVPCSLFPSFFVANFSEDYIRCCALYHDRNDEESSRSKPNGVEVK